jgi:hypothetical protein
VSRERRELIAKLVKCNMADRWLQCDLRRAEINVLRIIYCGR